MISPNCRTCFFYLITTGGDSMSTEKPRYSITVDEEMLKEIEDFRFNNRFPNRNQATIELIRLGLEKIKETQSNQSK